MPRTPEAEDEFFRYVDFVRVGRRLRSEADLDIATVDHERVDGADGDDRHASDHTGRHASSDDSERLIEPYSPRGRPRRGHAEGHSRIPVQPLTEPAAIQADVIFRLEREPVLDVAVRGLRVDHAEDDGQLRLGPVR